VLIVADDLRPDALGFSGNRAIPTPHLDALARRGARFTRATCSYPICNVSRSEIFSGRLMLDTARAMGGAL
jgi:arylsulfatase A-like enzyme